MTDVKPLPELPEDSILDREDYLKMQRVASNEVRYNILNTLIEEGSMSATELTEELGLPSNKLHYHLDQLVEVGLVHYRKSKNRDENGFRSYYTVTTLAEVLLNRGIRELIEAENRISSQGDEEKHISRDPRHRRVSHDDTAGTEDTRNTQSTEYERPSNKSQGRTNAAEATLTALKIDINHQQEKPDRGEDS